MRLARWAPGAESAPEFSAEALAQSTHWSAADWQHAINTVNLGPGRAELFRLVKELAGSTGRNPAAIADTLLAATKAVPIALEPVPDEASESADPELR